MTIISELVPLSGLIQATKFQKAYKTYLTILKICPSHVCMQDGVLHQESTAHFPKSEATVRDSITINGTAP